MPLVNKLTSMLHSNDVLGGIGDCMQDLINQIRKQQEQHKVTLTQIVVTVRSSKPEQREQAHTNQRTSSQVDVPGVWLLGIWTGSFWS